MALYLKKYFAKIRHKTLKKELQLLFLNRLSRLLKNGYTLIDALEIIQWDAALKLPAATITACLKNGSRLDQAFEQSQFNSIVTSYLYFVRANGDIQASIDKCLIMYEQRLQYTRKFQQVARYPAILLIVFSVVLYFIKHSVLPSFQDLFQGSGAASSILTISVTLIDMGSALFIWLLILAIIIAFLWQFNKRKIPIDKQIKLYNAIPFYRHYKQIHVSFLFATHFSSLLKTGISIKEILTTMSKQGKIPILAYYANLMMQELNQGKHLSSLLSQFRMLDKQIPLIFQKNADSSALEKDLSIYAEFLTDELHRKIMKNLTYIQPIFFLVLAGLIVFIYMSLMWPMFQLIKTI
ncbi:competence type IV pilus assembly protein ComGB [Lentibacillus sp. N15]|uniref:competence type IV pilus assembly protein ComGB n=1 Tax=Lentibacillus songyuanensis TaxID=3136161 RepID=UPI0031B9B377